MSAVAVQHPPSPLLPAFRQKQHAAAPPASITASSTPRPQRQPGIITLSKPLATPPRSSVRARKATPPSARAADVFQPASGPRPDRSAKKPRSRPVSDEEEHDTPSKPRGRRSNNAEKTLPTPAASPAVGTVKPRPNQPRTRQSSPASESDPAVQAPVLQKPSGRLAKQRRGLTRSTPVLCAAAAAPSTPVPIPQLKSASSHPSGLSRSAPLATPALSQTIPARMRRTLTNSEPAQVRDSMPKDVPPSPSPSRRARETSWKSYGPLTAPLNGGAGFPRPAHVRSPSEALFNFSLDETDDEPQQMPILFNRGRGGDKVYAGGKFQNGPDTTTLPAPSFLADL